MDTQTPLPHLEGVWFLTVRDYLCEISGSTQIAGMTIQSLERHGDQYIMDMVLATTSIKPSKVKFVNYCPLYLHVLTLSNMCNAAGTELSEGILAGYCRHSQSFSILEDLLQERPNEHVWGIWRRFLKTFCYDKDQLMRLLGPWFARFSTRRRWPNHYLPMDNHLICMTDGKYPAHRLVQTLVVHYCFTVLLFWLFYRSQSSNLQ
jgi:hypothetical protein